MALPGRFNESSPLVKAVGAAAHADPIVRQSLQAIRAVLFDVPDAPTEIRALRQRERAYEETKPTHIDYVVRWLTTTFGEPGRGAPPIVIGDWSSNAESWVYLFAWLEGASDSELTAYEDVLRPTMNQPWR